MIQSCFIKNIVGLRWRFDFNKILWRNIIGYPYTRPPGQPQTEVKAKSPIPLCPKSKLILEVYKKYSRKLLAGKVH